MKKNIGLLLEPETSDLQINIQLDSQAKITTGLTIGNITTQNQSLILTAYPGEFKENPTIGVGINDILQDNDLLEWRSRIRRQLENEGFKIRVLKLDNPNELLIDAEY